MSDTANFYEYLCRTCGHHERKHAGYPLACVACDSHNLLRTPLFREPKPGEYDIWARDQHIEVLKAEIDALRAENVALAGERDRLREALEDIASREWEYFEDSSKPRGVGDAYCTRCLSTAPTVAGIVHEDGCPFAVLNEEPTDGE